MKTLFITFCLLAGILIGTFSYSQTNKQTIYGGVGIGFDYGGIGLRAEVLPAKFIGIFGGIGYNLLSVGWNVGGSFKILPDKRVTPTVTAMYGYNGVFKGIDSYASKYDMTSYGVSFGGGVEYKFGSKGHKLCANLFVPIRSSKFKDNYDQAKEDSMLDIKSELLPFAISIGVNFAIN